MTNDAASFVLMHSSTIHYLMDHLSDIAKVCLSRLCLCSVLMHILNRHYVAALYKAQRLYQYFRGILKSLVHKYSLKRCNAVVSVCLGRCGIEIPGTEFKH